MKVSSLVLLTSNRFRFPNIRIYIITIAEQWDNRALRRLLWPLVVEQVLGVTMGMADTVMVSSVGEFAVSGISLVDAINMLLIIAFGALATGGAVVVSQFIGRRDEKSSCRAAKQLVYASAAASILIMTAALILRLPLLKLIYGKISPDVMKAAETYFWLSAISYPFLALYNASASLFRSIGNSRVSMLIAFLVNILNIGGNAFLIFGLHMGVAGAAISTLVSRAAAAIILTTVLVSDRGSPISLSGIFKIKIDYSMIRSILRVGIPSCIESGMFQIGKILVSRIFTFFGTAAIAANAISGSINSLTFMPANAFGIAMLTLVGQSIGAKDYESAKRFTSKLMKLTYATVLGFSLITLLFINRIIGIFNLSAEAQTIAKSLLLIHCIMSPIAWPLSFTLPNALRAAGDARYCMIVAVASMWIIRVLLAYVLAYFFSSMGPICVWIAMVADWCLRGVLFGNRWHSGKWREKAVIE